MDDGDVLELTEKQVVRTIGIEVAAMEKIISDEVRLK